MEEFSNLKVEHAFMKTKLLIYKKKVKEIKSNNGRSYTRNKLVNVFGRHLSPIRKMKS
jgi:hypothetical protein